jgi:NADPH:quinone reductase-like Zn-dependent oxidoreductase
MKALRFSRFGPPSVLAIEDVPRPEPRDGEALVQVKAAAINPSDVVNVSGHFPGTTLPRTPGRDFSGVVVVGKYQGEEVWSSGPGLGISRDGVQAEYVTIPEEALSLKPRTLSLEQAAAIGVPFLTAWLALVRAAQLEAGETILIVGAAGAVGQAATQIANWRKARVLAADRSSDTIPGAAAVINTTTEDVRERVFALTQGKGADAVFDTVGGAMFEPALRSLRLGGREVVITSTGDRRVSFDLVDFYHNLSRLIGADSMKLTPRDVAVIAEELRPGFEATLLKAPPVQVIPFENAIEAYERIAGGQAGAKQVLTFSQPAGTTEARKRNG